VIQRHDEAQASRAALTATGFEGEDLPAHLLGVNVRVLLDVDHLEHERRQAAGLGALTSRPALRVLCTLPAGERVRVADLTPPELRQIAALPPGAVDRDHGGVTRCAVPVVSLRCVVVIDRNWHRGLDRASTFAPFTSRILALPTAPRSLEPLVLEANFYGIGVVVTSPARTAVVAAPAAFRPSVLGPVAWRLREEAYAMLLASLAGDRTGPATVTGPESIGQVEPHRSTRVRSDGTHARRRL
jgi:hypothetical protein